MNAPFRVLMLLIALTVSLLAGTSGASGQTAKSRVAVSTAAASCSGASCTGLDPEAAGCGADGRTVSEFTTRTEYGNLARVQLRHSNTCRAKWVRATVAAGDFGCGPESDRLRIRDFSAAPAVLSTQIATAQSCRIGGSVWKWTKMVGRRSASYRTEYCFRSVWGDNYSSGTDYTCRFNVW